MSETDLQALERFVVESDELLALEEQIGRFNLFEALGVARAEIRHSNCLAWLLTPSESHGQGDLFLKAFLMDVLRRARQQGVPPPVSPVELDGADLRGVQVRREWRRIDLAVTCESPSFVVVVENKIDAGEHSNQLERYETIVAAELPNVPTLFVLLTPGGESATRERWVTYSYADLHRCLSRTHRASAGAIGGDVGVFLDHYLNLIGNRFMENEEIDRLCRQIYSTHRRALDLIWERVGTPASGVVGAIQQWLQENSSQWHVLTTKQSEVEFVPDSWMSVLPPVGRRKTFDPRHWLTARLHVARSRLRLMVVVCPTTDPEIRRRALERLLRDKDEFGFSSFFKRKELTEDWTRILSEDVCSLPEEEEECDLEAVMQKVAKRLERLQSQAAKAAAALREIASERIPAQSP